MNAQKGRGGLLWLLLVLASPVAVLVAVVTDRLLRWRWPIRAVAWSLVAVGAVGAGLLLWLTDYVGAWLRAVFGWWQLPEVEGALGPPVDRLRAAWPASPGWTDVLVLVGAGLFLGALLGGVYWRRGQVAREANLARGVDEEEKRLDAEARFCQRIVTRAQDAHNEARSGAVRAAVRPLTVPLGDARGLVLGRYLRGDLGGAERSVRRQPHETPWRIGHNVVLPLWTPRVRHVLLLGRSGYGKTEMTLRACELALRRGAQVVYISAKEPPTPSRAAAPRLTALTESLGKTARVLRCNGNGPVAFPFDPMRGTREEVQDRLLSIKKWTEPFYEDSATLLLALAFELAAAAGEDLRTLPDVVEGLTRSRLRGLVDRSGDPRARDLLAMISDNALEGAMMRYGASAVQLRGWIGADGWSYEDGDGLISELPTSSRRQAAPALLRLQLADFRAYMTDESRRDMSRPILLVIEEVGAVTGDEVLGREFRDLVERAREANVTCWLTAQAPSGVGDEATWASLATNAVVVTYAQQAEAEAVAKLAGTYRRQEASENYDAEGLRGGGSTRTQEAFKLSPNLLRKMPPYQVAVIAEGSVALAATGRAPSSYTLPASENARQLLAAPTVPEVLAADATRELPQLPPAASDWRAGL